MLAYWQRSLTGLQIFALIGIYQVALQGLEEIGLEFHPRQLDVRHLLVPLSLSAVANLIGMVFWF